MVATPKIHKVGINLLGNDLIRPKLGTTTLLSEGELGFTGTYLKFYDGGVERDIGGNAANALRLDEFAVPTSSVNLNSQKITNLLTPTSANDAANKAYVDAVVSGLDPKQSVRAATTASLAVTYNNGTGGVGATLTATSNGALAAQDGVTLAVDDRLLVKNQGANALQNGLYVLTQVGDGSNPFILTRATDADDSPDGEVTAGMFTFVEEGTTYADTGWVLATNNPITIGTTALLFTQFSSAGVITAGNGLTQTGSTIDVVSGNTAIVANANDITLTLASNSGLEISSGLKVASTIAGAGITLTSGVLDVVSGNTGITVNANDISLTLATNSGLEISSGLKIASTVAGGGLTLTAGVLDIGAGDGITVNANDVALASTTAGDGLTYTTGVLAVGAGTGISVTANAVAVDTSVVARKYIDSSTITGDGSTTDFVITHSLSNQWVSVTVINETSLEDEVVDIERTSSSTCTVKFAVAPANDENYTVVVIG